ncbi:MAG TPA: sn-glycerol-3-phosphate ABC transporter ATP-binding protein UgpC [Pararobbsia sp.]|jgi:multiple sugar transport system ATP-binding protein|nr:sn-glycerol-3-phosphate ABC transporter ATP-binding protein UgpC [Pararobbsia sp.]
MASISLSNVYKAYGTNAPVIRDVNLQIDNSEFCVFLGPSGCGKSTLLRMVAGLETITAGELKIGGQTMNLVPPSRRKVAMVFQNYALYPHMTVRENLAFGLKQAKKPADYIDQRIREAARILELEPLLDRKPKALSGGQRQRVAIGRAIVREPGVFLFDEPLSNLDAALRVQTRTEIARLHKAFSQASAIYVTHDQIEAMALADKIVLLHSGKDTEQFGSIAQVGPPLELYHRPRSKFVAGFIGSPKMNFIEGAVASVDAQGVVVRLRSGESILASVDGAGVGVGASVTLGIRPEHFVPDAGSGAVPDARQTITRPVRLVERLGEHSYVHLDSGDNEPMIAKLPGDAMQAVGDRISLGVPASACHVFDGKGLALPVLAR